MAVATVTNSTLATGFTQAQLVTAIETALGSAGLGSFSTQAGTTTKHVGSKVVNAAATKSTVYLETSVTNTFGISAKISDNYNTTTFTATNQSGVFSTVTFVNTSGIAITALNHPEMNVIVLIQGSTSLIYGISRPLNKPAEWNENNFLYAFMVNSDNNGMTHRLSSSTSNPHNYSTTNLVGCASFQTATGTIAVSAINQINNRAPAWTPVLIGGQQGAHGSYSDDVQAGYASGSAAFPSKYVYPDTGREYTMLSHNVGILSIALRTL
jgi:hypothetical protein